MGRYKNNLGWGFIPGQDMKFKSYKRKYICYIIFKNYIGLKMP